MATVPITAPTPMMMPSMVRIVRSLFRASARSATRMISRMFMRQSFRASARPRSIAAESRRTLPTGRSLAGRCGRDHERIAFVDGAGQKLRVVIVGDADLNRYGTLLLFVVQLPDDLPTAEMRGRGGA